MELGAFRAPAPMCAAMTAEQQRARRVPRPQLQLARRAAQGQQPGEVRLDHGAGTRRSSSATQACAVMPRACAP